MARNHMGRHRTPGYSPLNELGDIAARSAQPAMKASAVAVASGGLVAAFAIPASAAPGGAGSSKGAAVSAPQSAPVPATETLAVAAPAVASSATPTFGLVGFSGKASEQPAAPVLEISRVKPVAAPNPAPARASRAATRTPVAAASDASAPAPTGGLTGIAASLSGILYRYGGTTPAGFDCSGYTGYVYAQAGISIPRTAEAQRSASSKVSNPVPGDLIFFGFPAYHVGIYAGDGQLYDSARPGTYSGVHSIWTQKDVSYGRF